jgi:phytoene dehydrogenase-like protein
MSEPVDVVIIGGGVSGLACAKALHAAGRSFVLYEAREALGGRVMTDRHEGFLLDRGFQVLLTAYPEARQLLDYDRLHLRRFYPGALVRFSGRWHRMADSFRHPWDGLCSLFNPIGTLADKLRVGRLRLLRTKLSTQPANESTLTALQLEGFSESMIQRFFRPFLGGVYLESDLQTTAAKFASVFRYFSYGDTAVPALGMGAIPNQLACTLPPDRLRTGARVRGLMDSDVQLDDGTCVAARAVVVAAGKREAARILNEDEPPKTAFSGVTCLYFDAPVAPLGNRFWS